MSYFCCLSRFYLNRNLDLNSNNENLANSKSAKSRRAFQRPNSSDWLGRYSIQMKTRNKLYNRVISFDNLMLAYKKARKGKTKKKYVRDFEENLGENLYKLHTELLSKTYEPKPLKTFVIRDPKTRKISKSDFRDRVIHHAVCNIIEPIFDKTFIFDSYANRIGKSNLKAVDRFHKFMHRISNKEAKGYCLKADIRHYFHEVDHEILLNLIKHKIKDKDAIWLIQQIISNTSENKGMPLGNLTSQFLCKSVLERA